jgi:hypothetical protein
MLSYGKNGDRLKVGRRTMERQTTQVRVGYLQFAGQMFSPTPIIISLMIREHLWKDVETAVTV